MRYSKYTNFDPLRAFKVAGSTVTCLHLASWRGDMRCLKLLIEHGANVNARSEDGRNSLHYLYHYCNKPCDLVQSTELLIQHGIDVNTVDSEECTPLIILLFHIFVKRSHVRLLANRYMADYEVPTIEKDNYHDEIMGAIQLLVEAGASVNQSNKNGETALHTIYNRFRRCLKNCDEEFQTIGHDIVPYQFRVAPLVKFSRFMLEKGANVSRLLNCSSL